MNGINQVLEKSDAMQHTKIIRNENMGISISNYQRYTNLSIYVYHHQFMQIPYVVLNLVWYVHVSYLVVM